MLNLRHAMDPKKVGRFGQLFQTIDIDPKEGLLFIGTKSFKLSDSDFDYLRRDCNLGHTEIEIRGYSYTLTKHETRHLADTITRYFDVRNKMFKLGLR